MSLRAIGTTLSALALAVTVPMSSAAASVRPGSAVPAASASASAAGSSAQFGGFSAVRPWPAYAVIAMTLAMAVWIAANDNDGEISISRG